MKAALVRPTVVLQQMPLKMFPKNLIVLGGDRVSK